MMLFTAAYSSFIGRMASITFGLCLAWAGNFFGGGRALPMLEFLVIAVAMALGAAISVMGMAGSHTNSRIENAVPTFYGVSLFFVFLFFIN